ncbi:MAG: sugar nucleotide-binding protein [Candidatus Scalindua sp.]|jgi:nucleoside-diphosphate-sugar epimerase|nr:sugar nucleotide-binding protein [Candidatus Scalindua sp.]MBT5304795.1 sugar nucleotide-binding protein [Candidatus Scalindua sp.]MBT6046432.1 sugar nucleotide-binding protein [Candidatus Scalindua sp.]MBT6229634.1 sugar nucleotide-binding protein [Candidatus Scalindua sp.]MBT6562091.1 sugar nucleotide-binding protein [Candidatus Scalindua sp.]
MAKILIAGCGDIGTGLGKALSEKGHYVVGLRRHPPIEEMGIRFIAADLTNPAELADLDTDFDQVFFMAAPKLHDLNAYREIYEVGLNNLLHKLSMNQHSPHWISVSSTSVYGQVDGKWVDEDSLTVPRKFNGQLQLLSEQSVLAENKNNLIVRFSGIYGPGRRRMLSLAGKSGPIQFKPPYYTNRIHKEDCIGVLMFLFEKRVDGNKLYTHYLASDDGSAPMWDVVSWLAKKLKCKPPEIKQVDKDATQNKRCCNKRLKELGYRFQYPTYKEGYPQLIAEFNNS